MCSVKQAEYYSSIYTQMFNVGSKTQEKLFTSTGWVTATHLHGGGDSYLIEIRKIGCNTKAEGKQTCSYKHLPGGFRWRSQDLSLQHSSEGAEYSIIYNIIIYCYTIMI